MRIIWHGHSCFEVKDEVSLVIDPHDGKSIGIRPPKALADVVLVTHDHFDHNAVRVVQGPKTKVVEDPGRATRFGIKILGMPAYHDHVEGARRGGITIFKFVVDGITFCHLGDIGEMLSPERIRDLGKVDILFIPAGGRFTLEPEQAWQLTRAISPRVVVPMHYRLGGISLPLKPVSAFTDLADNVMDVGNEIDIIEEELPDDLETWVFGL